MPHSSFRRRRHKPGGFVLVMALVLIALAATLLARLASRSLALVDRATVRQQALQTKWSQTSCRLALLSRAEELLAAEAEAAIQAGRGWPLPATLTTRFLIAGTEYELRLADEGAKANLNTIDRDSPGQVLRAIAVARARGGGAQAPTLLRPLIAGRGTYQFRAYRSWGQLVDLAQQESPPWELADSLATDLTVWGSGKLNLTTASDDAVSTLLEGHLPAGKITLLLDFRRGWTGDLPLLLEDEELELSRRERILVRGMVTDKSAAYSLWIKARDQAGRESLSLIVADPTDRLAQRVQTYSW